ncbi:MAG: DUF4192 family protein [Agrococcus sp.]
MPLDREVRPTGSLIHLPGGDGEVARLVLESLEAMCDALPEFTVTVDRHFAQQVERSDIPTHGASFTLAIALVETCLDRDPGDMSPELLAQLVFMSQFPSLPEQMALQIAFGPGIAQEHARDIARLFTHARRRGLSVDDHVAELVRTGGVPDTRSTRCFRGETQHEPDQSRVTRGVALFRRAAGHTPETLRPSLLCVAAWLLWSVGKRPNALMHLGEAVRIDPEHVLAQGLILHLGARLPNWDCRRPKA